MGGACSCKEPTKEKDQVFINSVNREKEEIIEINFDNIDICGSKSSKKDYKLGIKLEEVPIIDSKEENL